MNRIDKKFKELKRDGEKAFVAFVTAGYPSLSVTKNLILELDKRGADIIELGVPFSDPMADGPVIQEASGFALKKGVNLKRILDLVKSARLDTQAPICLMTYYNPIFCFGEEKFISAAKNAGVDGLIIPDLPPEEGKSLIAFARKAGIDIIFFLSPTSSVERIKYISKVSRGFIYYVSLTGITGARRDLAGDLAKKIQLIKKYTDKPICVGFGVSTALQVKEVRKIADGVIVGSAIVNNIKQNMGKKNLIKNVGLFIGKLNV